MCQFNIPLANCGYGPLGQCQPDLVEKQALNAGNVIVSQARCSVHAGEKEHLVTLDRFVWTLLATLIRQQIFNNCIYLRIGH